MIKIMDPIKKGNNQPRDDIDKIDTQEEERENWHERGYDWII